MSGLACKQIICRQKALAVIDVLYAQIDSSDGDLKNDADLEASIKKSEMVIGQIDPLIYAVDEIK